MDIRPWFGGAPRVGAIAIKTSRTIGHYKLTLEADQTIDWSGPGDWRGWEPVETAMKALAHRVRFHWIDPSALKSYLNWGVTGRRMPAAPDLTGTVHRRSYGMFLTLEGDDLRLRLTAEPSGDLVIESATGALMQFVENLGKCPKGKELVERGLRGWKGRVRRKARVTCPEPLGFVEVTFTEPKYELVADPPHAS